MSKLIEGLARRLVEREAVPRRDLLTGRRAAATAGVVVPLVGAAGGAAGAVAAGAPRAGVAARPAKAPPLPGRSDLRAIHIAVMSSEARLKSQLIALVDALKTPASDGTFSSAANAALASTQTTVRKLHATIANVQPASSEQTKMLACLAAYEQMLTDLEQLGQSTDRKRAASLTAKIQALDKQAAADYEAVHTALNLPKVTR
jgi:hypothetical protein